MTGRATGRIQGDDLIAEVLRNMEEGLFHIRKKTIVPAIYRIYLNTEDFEPFRDIVPFISNEIRVALDERLQAWNGSKKRFTASLLHKVGLTDAGVADNEFVRAAENWTVEIYPDLDGKLSTGEIEVYSDLGAPQKLEYGGGSRTRRIFPKAADGPEGTSQPDAAATVQVPRASKADVQPHVLNFSSSSEEEGTKPRAFAYIHYADQDGKQTFEVTKSQIVIGRGGRSYWVDLKLETVPDVSREHCRIRCDPDTGRFTIEDLSQFGTAVDGKPVGRDGSFELPRTATISLAGVLDLNWEAN